MRKVTVTWMGVKQWVRKVTVTWMGSDMLCNRNQSTLCLFLWNFWARTGAMEQQKSGVAGGWSGDRTVCSGGVACALGQRWLWCASVVWECTHLVYTRAIRRCWLQPLSVDPVPCPLSPAAYTRGLSWITESYLNQYLWCLVWGAFETCIISNWS